MTPRPELSTLPSPRQRWLARLTFLAAVAAVVVLLAFAGLRSIGMIVAGLAGLAVTLAGVWWFLTHRGLVRWLSLGLAVAAPVVIAVLYTWAGLVWVVVVSTALWGAAVVAGRAALSGESGEETTPEYRTAPPRRPFLIMNPRSGGGKVGKYGLRDRARTLGAEVALLDGPGHLDVSALAREAVARGADLLGVAGGDGTQALVADVAAKHSLPFLVISAGTRNHFALDLGLDREDPATCLDALTDGVELRVDLGLAGDRVFVNNASFGAYADVVQSPAYRDDKAGTTLALLPELLVGRRGPRLVVHARNMTIEAPQAVLVSNNAYELEDVAGLGRRARLDRGVLGLLGIRVENTADAVGLLHGTHSKALTRFTAEEIVVDADVDTIPVGIDGEAVWMPTPVRCVIWPAALRVRVPRDRPGVPGPRPVLDWTRLRDLALATTTSPAGGRP